MMKAELGKEIIVTTVNSVGVLAGISKTVAEKGVSILAVSAWVDGVNGVVHLVTDDNLRAKEALEKKNYEVAERKVVHVELPHKPGMLKHMTEVLEKAGINIHHLYASAHLNDDKCLLIFASDDNDKAIVEIDK